MYFTVKKICRIIYKSSKKIILQCGIILQMEGEFNNLILPFDLPNAVFIRGKETYQCLTKIDI